MIIIYKIENTFFLIVNAINKEKDLEWINNLNEDNVIKDITDETSLVAIQGPHSRELLSSIINKY